jgi:integrase
MRKTSLSIGKTRIGGKLFWQVTVPKMGGGRERRTFKDRLAAQSFFELAKVQRDNFGAASMSIPESLRMEAMECAEILRPLGKTLRDAVKFYAAHLSAYASGKTVREVIAELLAARQTDGVSERYLSDLRQRLARFEAVYGETIISHLTAKQISDWLRGLGLAPLTRNTFRLRLAALFSFARRSGYVKESPLGDVEKAKERAGEVGILTVAETTRLLQSATAETLPYWAIGAFAGLRVAEIEQLAWEEVDFERGLIEVKAAKSKTGSRRHVQIQPNLAEWLAPYQDARGLVCPIGLRNKLDADREQAGLLDTWPQNALRHSFGSYHLARFPDAAALALQMGNSPAMIFKHYRELVKPAAAAKYWEIKPAEAGNVVAMKAA